MNKIKQWLRRWLGVEHDKKEFKHFKDYILYQEQSITNKCRDFDRRISRNEDIIGKTIRAGFDHHIKQPSWIVLAWRDEKGREHVHFYEVHKEYISQINDMLRSLKRENVIIDTHPQIHPLFKW